MNILVINAGSSSLKYQLFNMDDKVVLAKGLCERIGIDGRVKHSYGNQKLEREVAMDDHAAAIRVLVDLLCDKDVGVIASMTEIGAVGHRVVHGGEHFSESRRITPEVLKAIEECVPLAPLHNPPNLVGIRACAEVMGENVPQVAVFDTAFHQTMEPTAYLYAIPYEYYEKYKIRRYGFHGTSHYYVANRAAEILGRPIESLKIVTCHLGNGSSVAAVDGGRCVDTSMGLTPLEGLPMGTRCGNIDPAIVGFLAEHEGLTAQQMVDVLNKKSGMLGVSGVSSDYRDLQEAEDSGNARARLAVRIFCHAARKTVGAYAAAMGGVDALVFTAGVGENNPLVRDEVCKGLGFMGLEFDPTKNNVRGKECFLNTESSRGKILVVPTNEELVIAQDTHRLTK